MAVCRMTTVLPSVLSASTTPFAVNVRTFVPLSFGGNTNPADGALNEISQPHHQIPTINGHNRIFKNFNRSRIWQTADAIKTGVQRRV